MRLDDQAAVSLFLLSLFLRLLFGATRVSGAIKNRLNHDIVFFAFSGGRMPHRRAVRGPNPPWVPNLSSAVWRTGSPQTLLGT